jgi:hypothetical protein
MSIDFHILAISTQETRRAFVLAWLGAGNSHSHEPKSLELKYNLVILKSQPMTGDL